MTEWAARRFWTDVVVEPLEDGFAIRLDDRPVMTPGKSRLTLPTRRMAQAVAEEWRAQTGRIDPTTMPWTRSANSAIEKVARARGAVEAHLAEYAASDLLCYRAEAPEELRRRQEAEWSPVLDWVATRFDARLKVTIGVMPVAQPRAAVERLARTMVPLSHFELTGFHDLVTISGSFVLALAVREGRLAGDEAWRLSRLDEAWQTEQWGEDEEAAAAAEAAKAAFLHAGEFHDAAVGEGPKRLI